MSRYAFTVEPPKEPPTDGAPSGPAEPSKDVPTDGSPSGPPESPKALPTKPASTSVGSGTVTLERFEAAQAPATGRVMRTESPSGRTQASVGQEVEFSAPQAPGPASDLGAP